MKRTARSQVAAVAWMAGVVALALAMRGAGGGTGGTGGAWAEAVEAGGDHIAVADLTRRLVANTGDTVVVDVRPPAEFAEFHLAGSVRMGLPELLGAPGEALLRQNRDQLVVLVSGGMTHPGQAWVELWRRGHRNVRVLEGGLAQLQAEVLTPPSLRGPTTEARAGAEAAEFAAVAARLIGRRGPGQGAPASQPASRPPGRSEFATDPPRLAQPTVVSTAWVARRGHDLVLIDAREKPEDYSQGHLPGARHVPIAALRAAREGCDDLLPAAELARRFGGLGITADSEVVAYASEKLQDATHVLLALVSLGHRSVAVMDGGIGAWHAEGRPLTATAPAVASREYTVPGPGDFTASLAAMVAARQAGRPAIVDVRPADGFRGEKSTEARPGHIPGSLHRPYTADVVARDGGTFLRSRAELAAQYQALGLGAERPVVVTCRTGHQASQTWFVLRFLLGHQDVRWFDGSWQEWAAHPELPAELGEAKR